MTENQPEQVDGQENVDTGAQQPEPQVEQNPPGPQEGDEQSAPADDEPGGDVSGQRTDASGRVLNPWESSPKPQA